MLYKILTLPLIVNKERKLRVYENRALRQIFRLKREKEEDDGKNYI